MRQKHFLLSLILCSFNFYQGQEMIYDEANAPRITSRKVVAELGKDISAPAMTTVILDASRSTPSNGSLTYEWSFSPNLLFQSDYDFDKSDAVIPYNESELDSTEIGKGISIKKVVSKDKYIELEMPNAPGGTQFVVVLRVQNNMGSNDSDTLMVTVEGAINDGHESEFSDVSEADMIGESSFSVTDESQDNREPLTETLINGDYLTIQPLNKHRLNPMEVNIINSFIYDHLISTEVKNVLDPNRIIPSNVQVNKLYERMRFEPDTVLLVYLDTLTTKYDLSRFKEEPLDTIYNSNNVGNKTDLNNNDTSFVFRRYETVTKVDTLSYTEVVDTTLRYQFNCMTYDCAAENAFLEQAGQVLTWGINDYSQLEFHYFKLEDVYGSEPTSYWEAQRVQFSPFADSTLRYPESIGIDRDGSLLMVSGNRQTANSLGKKMHPINILESIRDEVQKLEYPSGICAGYLGEYYVSDKDANAVYKIYEGQISTIFSAKKDENGLILENEPSVPTSVRVDQEGNVVVLFEGDGSVYSFESSTGIRSLLLPSGTIKRPTDIAISTDGALYVVSESARQVYRVALDGSVIPFAGTLSSTASAMDGVLALESYLGSPVSIDFDNNGRLYIADDAFGSIRVVTPDGMISTVTNNENRVLDMAQFRVNDHGLTTFYVTHTLDHGLTRIHYKTVSNSSRFNYVHYPYHIIKQKGIYGLEDSIRRALDASMVTLVPEEEKVIFNFKKISDFNRKLNKYLKERPILLGLLLLLINQGLSAAFSDGGPIDLPPDFPF